jgi:hypothetical protein
MKGCYFCHDVTVDTAYVEEHMYGKYWMIYRICHNCAPKGLEVAQTRYDVWIRAVGRELKMDFINEKNREQWIKHLNQLHPIEAWLEKPEFAFYKFLYVSAMDAINGPLGQFTKAVKME